MEKITEIESRISMQPLGQGDQVQSKGCNGIMFDNMNGGGVTLVINNTMLVPPGTTKSIIQTDPRSKDMTDYRVTYDTANTYALNTSAVTRATAIIGFNEITCK